MWRQASGTSQQEQSYPKRLPVAVSSTRAGPSGAFTVAITRSGVTDSKTTLFASARAMPSFQPRASARARICASEVKSVTLGIGSSCGWDGDAVRRRRD